MTRRIGWNLAVALAAVALGMPAKAGTTDVSLLLGGKSLTDDHLDEAGISTGFQCGVRSTLDFDWPVALALDVLVASEDAVQDYSDGFPLKIETAARTMEIHFGVRRYFLDEKPVRPYVGGGLSIAQLKVRQVQSGSFGPGTEYANEVANDTSTDLGYWLGGGFGWFIHQVVLGADVRWSNASADISPNGSSGSVSLDSGGVQYALFVGYSW